METGKRQQHLNLGRWTHQDNSYPDWEVIKTYGKVIEVFDELPEQEYTSPAK